jgi:GT2 family glycosyltransferase/2-polyprenyl-3-methyl-5-hydroxy-6-metoxy-1,4-benzoquinol methylase
MHNQKPASSCTLSKIKMNVEAPFPTSEAALTDSEPDDALGIAAPKIAYYHHARPEILDIVPRSACKVLDVGCGAGGFSASLKARQLVEVHGVELVAQAAELARGHLDRVWNSSIEEALPKLPDGYYDCIVVADVLEHLLDPRNVLVSLKGKLAAGGRIVSSIPNVQNWDVLSNLIQGRWDYQNAGILDSTHLRFFTRKSVEELFWSAGLRITTLTTTTYGASPPPALLKILTKVGLSAKELERDGQTYQFLIEAEVPIQATTPKVVAIILNWNGKEDTLECLASVGPLDYQNYEVVVVDNGSTDDSVDAISEQYPSVTLLQTGSNLGYAGGNNVGIKYALDRGADYVLILNNDVVVAHDFLTEFVNAANLLPTGSVLGAKIYSYDQPDTLCSLAGRWNSELISFEYIGRDQKDSPLFDCMLQVDYVIGCSLFISADTFRDVGLLDEKFFLNYEETDWCYRASANGHKCIVIPKAKLWHKVSSSFGGSGSPAHAYFMTRNELIWAKKHLPRFVRTKLHKRSMDKLRRILCPPFILTTADLPLVKGLLWSFSSWLKTIKRNISNPANKAILIGLRDYYLGRYGDCPDQVRKLGKSS